ncbi:Max-binding protein MNT [Eumeta japonica]|uniref:Max-binding protein MNT n=1 Tax=Eumeta variegata TaxID=151549 RepID=A0A4C1TKE2_EUMVA|nr:Max-binding protein MNT [Eumeta japonica]
MKTVRCVSSHAQGRVPYMPVTICGFEKGSFSFDTMNILYYDLTANNYNLSKRTVRRVFATHAALVTSVLSTQVLRRKERECEHEMERLAREKIAAQQRLASLKREISARATSRPRSVGALEEKDRDERINGQIVGIPISITTTAAGAVTTVGGGLRVEPSASPPRTLNLSTKLRTLPIQITPSTSQVLINFQLSHCCGLKPFGWPDAGRGLLVTFAINAMSRSNPVLLGLKAAYLITATVAPILFTQYFNSSSCIRFDAMVVRTTYGARHNTLTLTALAPADVDVPASASAPLHQNGQSVENGVTTTLSTALVHPAQLHLPLSQVVGGGSVVVGSAALQLLSTPGALRVLQAPALHANGIATGENSRLPIENGIVSPPPSTEGGGTSVVVNGLAPLMVSQPAAHLLQTHSLTHKMVETQVVKGAVTPLTVSAQYLSATTIVKPVVVVSGAPTGPAPPAST